MSRFQGARTHKEVPHSALREGGSDDINFQSEESVDSHAAGVCRSESGTFEMLIVSRALKYTDLIIQCYEKVFASFPIFKKGLFLNICHMYAL